MPLTLNKGGGTVDSSDLFVVTQREVDAVLALNVPSHPRTRFDGAEFLDLLARAFSLTLEEKVAILKNVPTYSQEQMDGMLRILRDERILFADLNRRHNERLRLAEKARRGNLRLVK